MRAFVTQNGWGFNVISGAAALPVYDFRGQNDSGALCRISDIGTANGTLSGRP